MRLMTNKLQIFLAGCWMIFDFAFGTFVTRLINAQLYRCRLGLGLGLGPQKVFFRFPSNLVCG